MKRPKNFSSKRKSFELICLAVKNDYVNLFLTFLLNYINKMAEYIFNSATRGD